MGLWQAWKMAIKSILSNKGRSFLTMLGVIIGVGAVITAVAFAQGSTKNITDSVSSLGTNLVSINIMGRGSNRSVDLADLEEYVNEHADEITAVAPTVSGTVTAKNGTTTRSTTVLGTTDDYEEINDISVQEGRFLLPIDETYRMKVAIIGTAVANDLYPDGDAVGSKIKLGGNVFTVVGILEQTDNGQDSGDDDRIIIPVSAAKLVLWSADIRNFSLRVTDADNVDTVIDELSAWLEEIFNSDDVFNVSNTAELLETLSTITGTMMMVLGGIATISLLVGGIGIMNIMLVSVTERTREIGIRKAIGAKRASILTQFLIEAIVVTGMGGLTGVILGCACIKFILGGFDLVPEVYSPTWIGISFGISLVVGVIFGLFPAWKAAKMSPIEALRTE